MLSNKKRVIDYSKYKINFVIFLIFFIYLGFTLRLVYLQIINHEKYVEKSKKQYQINNLDIFDRGKIYMSSYNKEPVLIADVIEEKKQKNNKEQIERNRFYLNDQLASKVIGFVAYNENKKVGQYGVEKYYEDVLSRDSTKVYNNFFAELFDEIKGNIFSNKKNYEGDIVLTLDIEVQKELYKILKETKDKWQSDNIGAIVMDPNTGKIIAMEELPSFDNNNFKEVKDYKIYKNNLVSGVYEMGSIIKPLTVAAALDAQVVNENTYYNDVGIREIAGYKIKNYDSKARGYSNIQLILDKSLNIGIVFLVEQLGVERFSEYFKRFGLGKETGIDLPSEASGLTSNLDSGVFIDAATAGFGQGIALTPIQTIRALAVLGNGGKLVNPYIVDKIVYENGREKKIIPDDGEQVLKKDTSERISRMLTHVVDNALQNGKWKKDKYSIAAKTGTAQIPRPGGGYYEDRFLHSFFGYFPAYDPKFIIFIYHIHPKGAEYASQTLTEPFFELVDFLISYYQILPDR